MSSPRWKTERINHNNETQGPAHRLPPASCCRWREGEAGRRTRAVRAPSHTPWQTGLSPPTTSEHLFHPRPSSPHSAPALRDAVLSESALSTCQRCAGCLSPSLRLDSRHSGACWACRLPSARSRLPALPGHAGDRALPEALGNALSSGPRSACSGSWRPAQPPASPWTCPGWGPASVWTLGRPWFWPRLAGGWPCELAVWAHRFSRRRVPQLWSAERGHGTLPGAPPLPPPPSRWRGRECACPVPVMPNYTA